MPAKARPRSPHWFDSPPAHRCDGWQARATGRRAGFALRSRTARSGIGRGVIFSSAIWMSVSMSNSLHCDLKIPIDVRDALRTGISRLREKQVASYTLAAELLLLHVLGRDRAWLYAHPEEPIGSQELDTFLSLISRRANGEPTQHLTGKQDFWSLEFDVTPDVLIPRPETEHVIEVALDRLALRELRAGRPQKTNGDGFLIADIGTGSGCLAIALAKELSAATVYATDISPAALAVARRNAVRHGVANRIHFLESDLSRPLAADGAKESAFDLLVRNPPYLPARDD